MELVQLVAGPLRMEFDPELAFLRHVRLGATEIVRGVYAAVRDQDWNTIPFRVRDLRLDSPEGHFALSFLAKGSQDDIQFDWRGDITGTEKGVVRFTFTGEARSTFFKNRIGLCALHPIQECAGRACRIEHTDGSWTSGEFPWWISPHQPFKDIRSITHTVRPGIEARVAFTGEAFEMEDQRNWTDASFKTYGTPLERPFPVQVAAGTRIQQTVTIELVAPPSTAASQATTLASSSEAAQVRGPWQQARALPPLGLSMASIADACPAAVVERLKAIAPDHLRVDVRLRSDHWPDRLQEAAKLADQIDMKLEVAVFTEDTWGPAWQALLEQLKNDRDRIARWLVFHPAAKATPPELAGRAHEALRKFAANIPVVVGTDAYFAELNRNRPPAPDGALVCYSMNPQVHAFDSLSLRENLGALRCTVESAREIFGRPVVVSPVTLRPRFNPNATSSSAVDVEYIEPETDARQPTGFTAAWTIGVLQQLAAHPDVASLTLYETFGPRGLMDVHGEPYPVYSVLESLRRYPTVCATTNSRPLDVTALGLRRPDGTRGLLLGNMTGKKHAVVVEVDSGRERRLILEPESARHVKHEELA